LNFTSGKRSNRTRKARGIASKRIDRRWIFRDGQRQGEITRADHESTFFAGLLPHKQDWMESKSKETDPCLSIPFSPRSLEMFCRRRLPFCSRFAPLQIRAHRGPTLRRALNSSGFHSWTLERFILSRGRRTFMEMSLTAQFTASVQHSQGTQHPENPPEPEVDTDEWGGEMRGEGTDTTAWLPGRRRVRFQRAISLEEFHVELIEMMA
jgi:hypothetical protein